ncbi:glucose-6-phosphate dehydrogenase assembly protein OpcA [Auraticoccus monumenti]|uniref:Glucose-6-phosphate dehydrogenase assembly protein OpcA n=1 Tax=Auraticoccus monumenti TaxID=675864 RepID=A0A1G7DH75_9ACTN|nr:glucose-6-phosphate dehydrogenase assembly protein OpcA [Auraticoccus monumenti]SDE50769.1 glucose-6-phosphate dehydrogenase assembly protein OpcA [Auraticoccus monumenti]
MMIELKSTNSSKVASALIKARRNAGSPTMGMVMTLIVVTDGRGYQRAAEAALAASREHPCRLLLVVTSTTTKTSGLDAEIHLGERVPGETVVLRMRGEVAEHPASVVLPLLLPDSPVVAWWPGDAPHSLSEDPIGALANRRITDADGTRDPVGSLEARAAHHGPGETDLTWTRLTPWRALLAAAVDQYPATFTAAAVEAKRGHAGAQLMAAWLEDRLGVEVAVKATKGPGITGVRLTTAAGDISLTRDDGLLAEYAVPGQPRRLVALKRRDTEDLIAEELRRMDDDDIFESAAHVLVRRSERARAAKAKDTGTGTTKTTGTATKKTAAARKTAGTTKKAATSRPRRSIAAKTSDSTSNGPSGSGRPEPTSSTEGPGSGGSATHEATDAPGATTTS